MELRSGVESNLVFWVFCVILQMTRFRSGSRKVSQWRAIVPAKGHLIVQEASGTNASEPGLRALRGKVVKQKAKVSQSSGVVNKYTAMIALENTPSCIAI